MHENFYLNFTGCPSPPGYILVQRFFFFQSDLDSEANQNVFIDISWMATSLRALGVSQNYTVQFDSHRVKTTQLYYITELSNVIYWTSLCGIFLAYVTSVNGAGK